MSFIAITFKKGKSIIVKMYKVIDKYIQNSVVKLILLRKLLYMNYFRYKQINKDIISAAVVYYLRYIFSYCNIFEY